MEDSKVKLPYVLQHNQTDLEFLLWRARRIDYEVVVENRTLLFRPRKIEKTARLTLRRDIELLEFRPRMTTMGQVEEFTVRGWNPKEKKEIVGHSTAGDLPTVMGGTTSGPSNVQKVFSRDWKHARNSAGAKPGGGGSYLQSSGFPGIALGYIRAEGKSMRGPSIASRNRGQD